MHTIGLVADTHGFLDPVLCPVLAAAGVTHILHAGDIALGKKKVSNRITAVSLLSALKKVAPVDAVRGNTDDGELPPTLTYWAGAPGKSIRFVVHHGNQPDWKNDDAVLKALEPAGGWRRSGEIIVYGHSHEPRFVHHECGVAFLNPGAAGGSTEINRFGKTHPQQCAVVRCSDDGAAFEVSAIDLSLGRSPEHAPEVPRRWMAEATTATTGVASSRKRKRGRRS